MFAQGTTRMEVKSNKKHSNQVQESNLPRTHPTESAHSSKQLQYAAVTGYGLLIS